MDNLRKEILVTMPVNEDHKKYLEEKAMRMGRKPSVTADLQSKKMQVAGEKKKELQREVKKSETVI